MRIDSYEVQNDRIVAVYISDERRNMKQFRYEQARPHGEWIGDTDSDSTCKCSICRMTFDTDRLKMVMYDGKYEMPPCCPNCGSDNRKKGGDVE